MEVLRVYVSDGHNFVGHHGREPSRHPMHELDKIECVAGRGVLGDRFFDHKPDFDGQITFFALETHQQLAADLEFNAPLSIYRRNVITLDQELNSLIGQEFEVQGVRFLGTEECRPCYWMDQVAARGANAALRGKGGLRARILSSGLIHGRSQSGACYDDL